MSVQAAPVTPSSVAVAVDVGKNEFTRCGRSPTPHATGCRALLGCPMMATSVHKMISKITRLLSSAAAVEVGIEAVGTRSCCAAGPRAGSCDGAPVLHHPVQPWRDPLDVNPAARVSQRERCRPSTTTAST